jgi:2'-5' RNA ligase
MNAPSPWGQFAVVSYVPEPLASFVYALRGRLPGIHNPRPHITVLPPRPLCVPPEEVCTLLQQTAAGWQPFLVELEEVSVFPETSILYLSVAAGFDQIHRLHTALAPLGGVHQEPFPFRPHVTLGGPVETGSGIHVHAARQAWQEATCPRAFLVDSFELLWLKPEAGPGEWQWFSSFSLSRADSAA